MKLLTGIIRAGLQRPILLMVCKVYVPMLFPLTFLIALSALALDRVLIGQGLVGDPWLPAPENLYVAGASFVLGTFLWLWTYEQLSVRGEGSPSPTAGRTLKLVTTGIYAYSRNPSLFGKTLGVLAVGFALNSPSFCCILVPALLAGSLVEKVWRQEPQLVEVFGPEYEKYRADVPLFLPWKFFLPGKRK